ncbi:MAG: MipA/OmpV family protein [Sphingomonadales bacterium]|nr:MipA/OmpV family protein [Sphingomonadales bacterium]
MTFDASTKAFLFGFAVTAGLMLGTDIAHAQGASPPPDDQVSGTIALGVATIPEFEGAEKQRVIPLVSGQVRWGNRYFAIEGVTARLNVLDSETFELGPVAELTFGRRAKLKTLAVRALGRIDDAYQIGSFAAVRGNSVLTEGDQLRGSIQMTRDVSDVHKGWLGQAAIDYRLPVSSRFTLSAQTALRFADDKYARTYFSVSQDGATASGLQAFNAMGGIKDLGFSLTGSYSLSRHWSVLGYGGYRRLVGDFGKSPIVRTAGSRNQISGGVGVAYSF